MVAQIFPAYRCSVESFSKVLIGMCERIKIHTNITSATTTKLTTTNCMCLSIKTRTAPCLHALHETGLAQAIILRALTFGFNSSLISEADLDGSTNFDGYALPLERLHDLYGVDGSRSHGPSL